MTTILQPCTLSTSAERDKKVKLAMHTNPPTIPLSTKRAGHFEAQMKRMDDVQEIVEKLKEQHSNDKYTPEQIHWWANLIHMKKHSSYESLPQYRYFTSKVSGGKSTSLQTSPGKHIDQRSECIDQLKKLHNNTYFVPIQQSHRERVHLSS